MATIQAVKHTDVSHFTKGLEASQEDVPDEHAIRIHIRDVSEMPEDLIRALRAVYEESFSSGEFRINDDEE